MYLRPSNPPTATMVSQRINQTTRSPGEVLEVQDGLKLKKTGKSQPNEKIKAVIASSNIKEMAL